MSDDSRDERDSTPGALDWPVALRGVTESLVATLGPNDLWNYAALGLHAPDESVEDGLGDRGGVAGDDGDGGARVTARTWGNTRTRRNFERRGGGYVQFTRDPLLFVDAALGIRERDEPIADAADAWVEVSVERVDAGESGGTRWAEWKLTPVDAAVRREAVPTTNRGYYAVIEATVAASRLDVDAYDTADLVDRLAYFESVVETCGGDRERAAFERLSELVEWRDR